VSPSPLYRTVHRELRERIVSGLYPPGGGVPSERRLIEEFKVSLITVRRALDELVLDGLIERRQGVGSFVRDKARDVVVGMSSFTTDVMSGRLRLVRSVLKDALAPCPADIADRLHVQPGSMVRFLSRLDMEGGSALSIDEVFVPPTLAEPITPDIAGSPSFLFLWQEKTALVLSRTEYEVSARMPGTTDQKLLGIGPETPLLVTAELFHRNDGASAAWIVTRYRSDRTRLLGSFDLKRDVRAPGG
jgi:GntR family transcriptional regulator